MGNFATEGGHCEMVSQIEAGEANSCGAFGNRDNPVSSITALRMCSPNDVSEGGRV